MTRIAVVFATGAAVLGIAVARGCGSSSSPTPAGTPAGNAGATATPPPTKEVSPAGDIPDNQAYVAYAPPGAGFTVKIPEGWSRSTSAGTTTFTDKLNSVQLGIAPDESAATAASVTKTVLPKLAQSVPGYQAGKVTTVSRNAGHAVRVTYGATSAPDAVTGKTRPNAVERYEFAKGGRVAVLTLTGPVGADNVDPWKIVTDSFAWTR
jgi:hypothetical protein